MYAVKRYIRRIKYAMVFYLQHIMYAVKIYIWHTKYAVVAYLRHKMYAVKLYIRHTKYAVKDFWRHFKSAIYGPGLSTTCWYTAYWSMPWLLIYGIECMPLKASFVVVISSSVVTIWCIWTTNGSLAKGEERQWILQTIGEKKDKHHQIKIKNPYLVFPWLVKNLIWYLVWFSNKTPIRTI